MTYTSREREQLWDEANRLRDENAVLRGANQGLVSGGDRLRREHDTMLIDITVMKARYADLEASKRQLSAEYNALNGRLAEKMDRIRDQERELVELRGKQGAEELHDEPPLFQVVVDEEVQSDCDSEETADRVARANADAIRSGTVRVVEVRTEYVVEPARDRTVTKKRLGPNYITED